MIIKSSAIQLNSQHQSLKSLHESESLRFWKTDDQPRTPERGQLADKLSLSEPAKELKPEKQTLDLSEPLDSSQNLQMLIVKRMIEDMTGHSFKLFSPAELMDKCCCDSENVEITKTPPPPPKQPPSVGYGMAYEHNSVYQESESCSFSAVGTVQTQDGKSIEFSAKLTMSREFRLETNLSINMGDPEKKVDPLVINFDGNAAELSSKRFAFDLDSNGTTEQIASLKPGSGFLALDKNKDGIINDGTELFGPNSGNGFSELAKYDSDDNGFIDEADPVYKNLRIWQRHDDGSQQLIALGDKNIGAIYLGHATTPFQLKTADNQSLGEITDSGIYLNENGKTGTIQQINLNA